MKKNRVDDVENKLNRVKATFRLEGKELSDETMQCCRLILERKMTSDEAVALAIKNIG